MKIAVCVHLYHIDMWDEIKKYLDNLKRDYLLFVNLPVKDERNIPYDFDWEFYVSYYDDLKKANKNTYEKAINHYLKHGEKECRFYSKGNLEIISKLKKYKSDVNILLSPNKGVDIGGFLYTYKKVPKDVDLILKIHTKAGLGSIDKPSLITKKIGTEKAIKYGNNWFNDLINGSLGVVSGNFSVAVVFIVIPTSPPLPPGLLVIQPVSLIHSNHSSGFLVDIQSCFGNKLAGTNCSLINGLTLPIFDSSNDNILFIFKSIFFIFFNFLLYNT